MRGQRENERAERERMRGQRERMRGQRENERAERENERAEREREYINTHKPQAIESLTEMAHTTFPTTNVTRHKGIKAQFMKSFWLRNCKIEIPLIHVTCRVQ